MEKKETGKKEPLINQYGKRVINNWGLYAEFLARRERLKQKKEIVVSQITQRDTQVFKQALQKLMRERSTKTRPVRKALERLVSAKYVRSEISEPFEPLPNLEYVSCGMGVETENQKTKLKASNSIVKREKKSRKELKTPNSQSSLGRSTPKLKKVPTPKPLKIKKSVSSIKNAKKSKSKVRIQSRSTSKTRGRSKLRSAASSREKSVEERLKDKLRTITSKDEKFKKVVISKTPPHSAPSSRKEPFKKRENFPTSVKPAVNKFVHPASEPRQRIFKPVIIIPPFKTRPWNPLEAGKPKRKVKPVINYPPVKLRKT
jgi:hypothetical protein